MFTESIDFFSFSYDDDEVSKPCFVSLHFFPKILYLLRFIFFISEFSFSVFFID